MAHEIIMPALGMAQETGRLVAWLKNEGDAVKKGDPLMEVETDKSTMEVEAQHDGFLANVSAFENTDVPVGEVVALIVENLEAAPQEKKRASEKNNNDNEQNLPNETSIKKETKPAEDFPAPSASNGSLDEQKIEGPSFTKEKILASPKLRSLAAAENLNLIELKKAGFTEPFKAADLSSLRQLSSHQGKMPLRNNATSLVSKSSFLIFMSEINSASEKNISSELIFASFISASLRVIINSEIIGIKYKSGEELNSVLYQDPDKFQLENIRPSNNDMGITAEVCDLTATDFIQLSGDINSDINFTISDFSEQYMITLDWQPNKISQQNALSLLRDLSMRIKSPLKQLL